MKVVLTADDLVDARALHLADARALDLVDARAVL